MPHPDKQTRCIEITPNHNDPARNLLRHRRQQRCHNAIGQVGESFLTPQNEYGRSWQVPWRWPVESEGSHCVPVVCNQVQTPRCHRGSFQVTELSKPPPQLPLSHHRFAATGRRPNNGMYHIPGKNTRHVAQCQRWGHAQQLNNILLPDVCKQGFFFLDPGGAGGGGGGGQKTPRGWWDMKILKKVLFLHFSQII